MVGAIQVTEPLQMSSVPKLDKKKKEKIPFKIKTLIKDIDGTLLFEGKLAQYVITNDMENYQLPDSLTFIRGKYVGHRTKKV